MGGFVLFGLCFCLLLFMVLRLPYWLLIVCLSFALLFVGWFGLVVSPLLMSVLCLVFWMGLLVATLCIVLSGFGFVFFAGIWLLWPSQVGRAYRLLEMVSEGCPGHGPIHLLVSSAAEIGFQCYPLSLAWSRPGLPLLSNLACPIQHFRAAILDAWRNKAAADLCDREGFRGGPLLDIPGSLQVLNSSHVRDRDKGLLRGIMVGGVWNGFLFSRVKGQPVPCRFCGSPDGDGHLSVLGMYLSSSG